MNNFITCSVCGTPLSLSREVSESNVIYCPCCCSNFINPLRYGQFVKESNRTFNRGCLIPIGIIVVLVIIGSLANIDDYDVNSTVKNNPLDGSVHQVERYLKDEYLKDPKSYESIEWSEVQKNADGTYHVRHKYRAKNSFGGYVLENKIFHIDEKGNIIE